MSSISLLSPSQFSPSRQPPLEPFRGILPQAPREASSASVDASLPADELLQGLRIRLVPGNVPQSPAPFASGPFVSLGRVVPPQSANTNAGSRRHLELGQDSEPSHVFGMSDGVGGFYEVLVNYQGRLDRRVSTK
jgi:hypothetical protein